MINRARYILLEVRTQRKTPVLTLTELKKRSKDLREQFHTPRRPVKIVKMIPLVGNATLTVNAEAYGTKKYALTMTFYNIDYSEEQTKDYPLSVRPEQGTQLYMPQLNEDGYPVQIRCSCPDFRFTWAEWDKKEGALSGRNFPRYVRKTTTRPSRNPKKAPGLCKHLFNLVERLKREKILE